MKKILSFTIIGFLSTIVFAQVTDTNDKVGIGESNPQTKLHINVTYVNSEILRLDNAGLRATSFFNYSDGTYDNAGLQFKKNSSVGQFKFSNTIGDLMTILPDGRLNVLNTKVNSELLTLDNAGLRATSFFNYSDGTYDNAGLQFKKNSSVGQFKFSNTNGDLMTILPDGRLNILNTKVNSELLTLDNAGLRATSFFNYSDGTYDNAGLQFKKNSSAGQFKFSNTNGDLMTILSNGNVGIGTANTGSHKLAIEGSIGAREIKVEANEWSDFVFEKEYHLPSLKEVENYIKEKGHLKNIPSAEEVEENGIFLGEMNAKLLQKIEELTLYTISQEKKIQKVEK